MLLVRSGAALVAWLFGLTACGDVDERSVRTQFPLIDHQGWTQVTAVGDPFSDREGTVDCGPGGVTLEASSVEIDTRVCNYFTGSHPTLDDVEEGDVIQTVVWHLVLTSSIAAQAHIAVMLDDAVVLERRIDVPTPEDVYETAWPAPRRFPAGTPVYLHVHNHGFNTYNLGRVMVIPDVSE